MLAGCSDLFGPGGPRISVSLELQRPVGVPPVLQADIGGRRVRLVPAGGGALRASADVRGRQFGRAPVHVALLTPLGDTLATVDFPQQFERDHAHWVAALVGQHRPIGHCIGSLAVAPLRVGDTDTLFVVYGSIPESAIC
jgi:hypothetical protein